MESRAPQLWMMPAAAGVVALWILLDSTPSSESLWLLPTVLAISWSLLIVTARRGQRLLWTDLGYALLLGIRFGLIPVAIQLHGAAPYGVPISLTQSDEKLGVLFMAYEGITVTLLYCVISARVRRRTSTVVPQVPSGAYVPQLGLALAAAATLALPQVRQRFSPFWAEIEGTARQITSGYDANYDLIATLANLGRIALPGLFIVMAHRAYQRRSRAVYPTLAALGAVLANSFYVSTSRASVFLPLLAALLSLAILFPERRKRMAIVTLGGLAAITATVTIEKSFSSAEASSPGWLVNYLSTYFMGPREYAAGIRAEAAFGTSVDSSTLLADIFGNAAGLASLFDPLNRTSQFFNWTYLNISGVEGGGVIIPASVQGLFHVGPLLGPLFCLFGLALALVGEGHFHSTRRTAASTYVAALVVVIGTLYSANSVSILFAMMSMPIIPLALLVALDNFLASRQGDGSGTRAARETRSA